MNDPHPETPEERFHRLLSEALEAGRRVQAHASSRQNSLAVTHTEDALHRALCDLVEKGT